MKLLKLGIRFWITVSSMFSFLIGWILIAHAPKPNQSGAPGAGTDAAASVPTLQPLNPLSSFQSDDDDFFNQQPFFGVQPRNSFRPSFRTGGS